MILEYLTLENFGVYGGRQTVDLSPTDPEHPIILFGGMNGGGKTTLLDASQLVLYGPKARLSNRARSYRDSLKGAIHRGADPSEGAALELQFRRVVDGVSRTYRVRRAWRLTDKGIDEQLEVLRDEEPDSMLTEHWDEYIEGYIPSSIAHLFFFDAEQITELAEGRNAAELLGAAVHSLLGLELVDRLETDLTVLERRKRSEGQPAEEIRQLRQMEEEVVRLETLLSDATQERGRLTNETDRKAHELARCEERFRNDGGDLFLRRGELDAKLSRLRQEIAAHEHALRELAGGAAPFLLIEELLADTEAEVRRAADVRRNRILVDALEKRDAEMIDVLGKRRVPKKSLETVATLFAEDRYSRAESLSAPCLLDADEHYALEIRHLRGTTLPEAVAKMRSAVEEVNRLREQTVRVEAELARVPAADAIAAVQQEVVRLRHDLAARQAELQAHEARMAALSRDLERARAALAREAEQHTDSNIEDESRLRILKHSAKVRVTLQSFRREIIRKHAARIETLMLESFTQLLRNTNLVGGLHIDPDTFAIELTGGDGKPLSFGRLSAGERQLLATSLLWGLAKASGRPLPTIIDTPLGRLDSSHRRHLLERYFPVASHQVILLSTDEEITETNLAKIQPFIGRSYQLVHDEQLRTTTIQPGYFWNHEATC